MDREEFLEYINKNFEIDGATKRLIDNILFYASSLPTEEQYPFLNAMLDGTIGLSESEIRQIDV